MAVMLTPVVKGQDRNNEDEVVHLDQMSRYDAVPNQLLMKLQDYSPLRLDIKNPTRFVAEAKGLTELNAVLSEYGIASIEQLLPNFVMPKAPRRSPSFGGKDVVEKDLSQIYLITLNEDSPKNNYELIEALQALEEVEFAEPNYICHALGANETLSEAVAADGRRAQQKNAPKSTFSTNDPMYSLQWGFDAVGLDQLLMQPKLDSTAARKVIAIIDTGVDVDHPDLADNIWTNPREDNGASGQDDDGNGFIDDLHGWDFVNQTADMHDFNSHGTHCAGIAAAVGGNGIGIIGADPDALIMPVAVMQSDGTGDVATIVRGINYAAANGADVISMSIGTYAYSVAMEQALAQAYQTAVLVGAAGNDGLHIDPRCCGNPAHAPFDGPMFPGAFTFVFGVEATGQDNSLAGFSNNDCDGPSFSQFDEEKLYNYELSAPGVGIMSTVPGGQYRSYNGTSMATPLVAGGLASLLERRNYQTKEILFGDLINYSSAHHHVNFAGAYAAPAQAPAILQHVAYEVNDTAYGDSSMYADAGEQIQLYPTIRTVWGPADSIEVWLEFQEFEDTTTLTFINNHVAFGRPLSSYAKGKSINPIEFRIREDIHDGRHIQLTLCAASTDAPDTLRHDFTLPVTNGVKLHGMIQGNHTLYPNVQYIVTQNLALPDGDTLFIKPGVVLRIAEGVSINATIVAIGTPDSMITFTKTDLANSWEKINSRGGLFSYCIFEYMSKPRDNDYWLLRNVQDINNSIFRNVYNPALHFVQVNVQGGHGTRLNFYNNRYWQSVMDWGNDFRHIAYEYTNVVNNTGAYSNSTNNAYSCPIYYHSPELSIIPKYRMINVFNNLPFNVCASSSEVAVMVSDTAYYGSNNESIIREHIYDFNTPNSSSFGFIDLSNRSYRPCAEAHGIVWKVVVDGFDAQDEFDSIPPLGVGTHCFQVYFNRKMNTEIDPFIAMGVRPPYTQTAITEKGQWNEEKTIYTVYHHIKPTDAIDGLNRIYVANAKDDENFEIPYENQRFNVYINCAGSMSTGFQATPGIGKVELEWNNQEMAVEDFLGFNMYRYQYEQQLTNRRYDSDLGQYVYDTVIAPGDTVRLNQSLIVDTLFTDYDVIPGERYYYFYKILRSSLTENSPSKTVSCVPYSAIRGDANGSMNVDVLDVVTTVNYVTGQNPQPFLYDAADVNGDSTINVLDIVGIINIILHPEENGGAKGVAIQRTAIYTIEDGILYVNSPVALGGVQFTIVGCSASDVELLAALDGFEKVSAENDGNLTLIAYSMSGRTIAAGKQALLRLGNRELDDIVLSDERGNAVIALKGDNLGATDIEAVPAQIMKAFPNPFDEEVTISFVVGSERSGKARLEMNDMQGRKVGAAEIETATAGRYNYKWKASGMEKGVYFVSLYVDDQKAHTIKVVLK